jgi:hypothetical protein
LRVGICVVGIVLSFCAHAHLSLPTDQGSPFPDFTAVHAQVSSACASVRTMTAELSLSGHAGRQKLRGRVIAGFARPASMRLEGVAPFGPPAFILASRDADAVLLLPRDAPRVLRGASPQDILGALTGISLGPADLQAILTGCVSPMPRPAGGRLHANGWASIDLTGGDILYLQPAGGRGAPGSQTWILRAARRGEWQIEYPAWTNGFPQAVRLQSLQSGAMVDLTASISQLETNKDLETAAFTVSVPPGSEPVTLDELRETGPLGDR